MDRGAHRNKEAWERSHQPRRGGLCPLAGLGHLPPISGVGGRRGRQTELMTPLKKAEAKARTCQHVGCLAVSLLTFFASIIIHINLRVLLPACCFYMEFCHIPKHVLCLKCSI